MTKEDREWQKILNKAFEKIINEPNLINVEQYLSEEQKEFFANMKINLPKRK